MAAQKIFFKEHSKLDLFGSSDEDRSEIATLTKTRLVATSNKYGYAAIGYSNAIKIVTISSLESNTDQVTPVASIDLDPNAECVYLDLDFAETHLYVLTCSMPSDNAFEYAIYVYALESISLDKNGPPQSPSCVNRINLERDNQLIVDFCASTNEQEAIVLCKLNGVVQIITNLLEKQPKIVSKSLDAFCVCWSPKGKQIACCSRNNKLNLLDRDLTLKNSYECLKPDHIPTNINWLAKKHFIIFGVDTTEAQNPLPYYIEISSDKNSHQYSVKAIDYAQLTYSFDVDKSPSMDLAFINDWNLILCSNSKNSEIALLQRPPNSEIYDVLEIEDYKCLVPLSKDSMDLCPLGMVVNFNCRSQVKLEKFDMQPPSPIVIILADNGVLVTYFALNLESSNASICVPPSKMHLKSVPSMQQISQKPSQEQQQVSLGGALKPSGSAPTGSMFNFNSPSNNSLFNQSSQATPSIPSSSQFNFKNLPSDPSTTILSSTSSTLSQLVTSKTPSSLAQTPFPPASAAAAAAPPQQSQIQPADVSSAPFNFNIQPKPQQQVSFNIPQQQLPQSQPQFVVTPKSSTPQFPMQQQQQQQVQPPTPVQFEPKIAPKPAQQQVAVSSISLAEKINEFAKQINELKSSASKLFDGKELTSNLLDYSVIKKSKQVREKYSKINEEMQSLHDKCVDMRETLMTDFRNFEKLRLLKFNASNPKIASTMKQFELDPITREKYENIKKLYAYISRELPNIKSHVDLYKKKKQDQSTSFVSFDEVYESIRTIEILINQNSKHMGKLIDQIKLLKIDNNHLIRDLNLIRLKEKPNEDEQKKDETMSQREMSTYLEDSLETSKASRLYQTAIDESDLDKRVSRLELKGSSSDRDTLFFTQLYEILRKRKQIPVQEVNLRRLDLYDERFDRVDESTNLDTSSTVHKAFVAVTPSVKETTTLDSSFLKINTPNVIVQQQQQQQQLPPPPPQPQIQPAASQFAFTPTIAINQQQAQPQQQPKIVVPAKPVEAEPPSSVIAALNAGNKGGILPKFTPTPTTQSQQPSQTPLFNFQTQTASIAAQQQQPIISSSSSSSLATPSQQIQVPKPSQPPTTPPHQTQPLMGNNKLMPPAAVTKPTTSTPSQSSGIMPSLGGGVPGGGGLFSFNLAAPSTSSPAPSAQQPPLFSIASLTKPTPPTTTTTTTQPPQQPAFSFGTKSSVATSLFPPATAAAAASQPPPQTATTTTGQQSSEKPAAETAVPKPAGGPFTPVTPSQSSDSVSQLLSTKVAEEMPKALSETAKKEETPKPAVVEVKKDEVVVATPVKPSEEIVKESEKTEEVKKPVENKAEPESTPSTSGDVKNETAEKPVSKTETTPVQPTTTTTVQQSTSAFTLGAPNPTPSLFGTQPTTTTPTTSTTFPSLFNMPAKPATAAAAPFSLSQTSSSSSGAVNPFTAMTAQKPASNDGLDADMDASTNTMSSGLSFGGLGSSKPLNAEAPKNVFGFSFGNSGQAATSSSTTPQSSGLIKPSVFGAPSATTTPAPVTGGILKTPTFTSPTSSSGTGLFGSTSTTSTGSGGGGLFSQAASSSGGGLFSSFKSPDKPATSLFGASAAASPPAPAFGAAPTFGGAPLFGSAATFGAAAPSAAVAPTSGLFGASSTQQPTFGATASFGSTESKPLFGAGSLSAQPSGFSALAAQSGGGGGGGGGFATFGQSAQMPQMGFGNLAAQQQQPQQNLFSSFSQTSQAPSFAAPNSSSFTAYRK